MLHRGRWNALRLKILARDGWRCQGCGRAGRLEVDHVIAVEHGGDPWDAANLRVLCRSCHIEKTRRENCREPTASEAAWRVLVDDLMRVK